MYSFDQLLHYLAEAIDSVNISLNGLSGIVWVITYVLFGLGLYTMAKKRGIENAGLAWVPVARQWILGCVSDQYRYVVKGEERKMRRALLIFDILVKAALPLFLVILGVIAAVMAANGGHDIGSALVSAGIVIVLLIVALLAWLVLAILLLVFRSKALCDLFASAAPAQKTVYSVLGILGICLGVEFVPALLIFLCREKEEGMPPRQPEQAPPTV